MDRRYFLALAATTAITGCGGADTDSNSGDGGGEPNPEPTPTPTATPTDTPVPTATPIEFEGTGSQGSERFTINREVVFFGLVHNGRRNFAVWLKNSRGEREELLANTIGRYQGIRVLNLPTGDYFLDVTADAGWGVHIQQFHPFSGGGGLPVSESAPGAMAFGPLTASGAVRMTFEGSEQSNYGVWLRDNAARRVDLLFNEIGPTGALSTVFSAPDVFLVTVETDSAWEGTIESA